MAHLSLPPDYGVAELADGRFYPITVSEPGTDYPDPHFLHWQYDEIPPAHGPLRTHGVVSFAHRQDAGRYCHRYEEQFRLRYQWQQLVAESELHPDRNTWYRAEVERLINTYDDLWYLWGKDEDSIHFDTWDAQVSLRIHLRINGTWHTVRGEAPTLDEAWEALYAQFSALISHDIGRRERHPERTIAYQDAIEALTCAPPTINAKKLPVVCYASLAGITYKETGETIDEALERLCEQLYEKTASPQEQGEPISQAS